MINPRRLKRLLENMVVEMFPHKPDCNLVREVGTWGIGCTCPARHDQERFKEEIYKLEEPDSEEES